jgi:C-3',4' desaturase CrtD
MTTPRILVIGAGIGGLTAASLLAQAGYSVKILEAQTYVGGSASTFFHKGYRFDSGATVAGGFHPNGPHAILGKLLDIEWPIHRHEPAWVVHLPDRSVALTEDYADVLAKFPESEGFWQEQSRIAKLAWDLSAQGLPWPPQDLPEFWQLAALGLKNFPRDLALLPYAFSTVQQWASKKGLGENREFLRFLDASLLISAQNTSEYVNAIYGATALDLARQGVYHVEGGIGGIAETLLKKFCDLGGEILFRQHVKRIEVTNQRVTGVYATKGRRSHQKTFYPADFVIANTTPWSLDKLLGKESPLKQEIQRREATQGAFVLHLGLEAAKLPKNIPDHHQIVSRYAGTMGEGETLYLSISPEWDKSRAPEGQVAATISTHTKIQQWWDLLEEDEEAYQAKKQDYAERMIAKIDTILAGFKNAVTMCMAGTPVTYEFYTLRHQGMVGGFPQTSIFNARSPKTGIANLRLVGDSIFPGQSTAGVTLGGIRVAKNVMRQLPLGQTKRSIAKDRQA